MKKVLITSILILAIISSLLAGTVSYYTTSVDNLAGGSVTAKEFIFLGEGSQSFTHSEAIAPSETVKWSFKVRNFKESTVTETDQYYKLNIDVTNADGKEAIQPLQVTITDQSGKEHSVTGTGSFSILDDFPIKTDGQEHEYQVTMYWPSGDNDIDYAGNGFGNSVKVSAIASQVPFDSETKPVEPEEPGEPGEGGEGEPTQDKPIEVNYHVVKSWTDGNPASGIHKHEFAITIKNNTNYDISDWQLSFTFPSGELVSHFWGGTLTIDENDYYKLTEYSEWTNSIIPALSNIPNSQSHPIGSQLQTPTSEIKPITNLKLVGKINGEMNTFESDSINLTFTPYQGN